MKEKDFREFSAIIVFLCKTDPEAIKFLNDLSFATLIKLILNDIYVLF